MMNADDDALRAARPGVAVWVDKLRHAGHVVLVRKIRRSSRPNAGFRISVDGRTMSVWELWARFRSELGDENHHFGELDLGRPKKVTPQKKA
jgi:hypothetical protein